MLAGHRHNAVARPGAAGTSMLPILADVHVPDTLPGIAIGVTFMTRIPE